MAHTARSTVVASYIVKILKEDATLALQNTFYGDDDYNSKTPWVSVAVGPKSRDLTGMSKATQNDIRIFITLYYAKIQDIHKTYREADRLAEEIELKLHKDLTLGGNIVHGYVTSVEPGVVRSPGGMFSAVRLDYYALTKTLLGVTG